MITMVVILMTEEYYPITKAELERLRETFYIDDEEDMIISRVLKRPSIEVDFKW